MSKRTSDQIKQEILSTFGFLPPFFEPAFATPAVLESLWQQTLTAYVENPIPALFKEKLAASIARFCTVPYCLLCHSSTLRPLGMKASEVLSLLQEAPIGYEQLAVQTQKLESKKLLAWPEQDSEIEQGIYHCSLAIFLNQDTEKCQAKLRQILPTELYDYLNLFLAYNKTCLSWAEAHPELNYTADKRVQDHYAAMVNEDPKLADFFENYRGRVVEQVDRRSQWLTEENKLLVSELKQSQEWLSATLHGIGDAVIATDAADTPRVTFLNGVAEELTGWTSSEATGKFVDDVFKIINEETRKTAINPIAKVIASGKIEGLANHTILVRRDLTEFVIEDSAAPILHTDGSLRGAVLIFRDITEQKKLERERHEANKKVEIERARLKQMFEQMPNPVAMNFGADHLFTYVNAAYKEILFGGKDVVGKTLAEALPETVEQGFNHIINTVYKTGVRYIGNETQVNLIQKDGSEKKFNLDFVYEPIKDYNGQVEGILTVVSDVTDKVKARRHVELAAQQLDAEKNKLEVMILESPAAMALFRGPDTIFELVNQKWKDLVGHRDYIGKTYVEAYPRTS